MKVAVYLDTFNHGHEHREGQLVMGFSDLGVPSSMVTLSKPELRMCDALFPILTASRRDVAGPEFWRLIGANVVILFTWFRPHYFDILAAVRRAGAIVVIKADSDGRVAPPVSRRVFTIPPPRIRQMPRWIAGRLLWRLYFGRRAAHSLVQSLINSDAVIVESPSAMANLAHILVAARRPDLVDRLWQIPNPVCPEIANGLLGPKENVLVAVGRWDDYGYCRQKNTMMMVRVLMGFLAQRPDYRAMMVGPGATLLNRLVSVASATVRERIKVTGSVPHAEVGRILATSRMLFMPSVMESFGFAAFEAVCAGCSVVGTPIEPLQYATMGGLAGTLASDFTYDGLLAALLADAKKWDRGEYIPEDTARRWRALLDRKVVAQQFLDKLTTISSA